MPRLWARFFCLLRRVPRRGTRTGREGVLTRTPKSKSRQDHRIRGVFRDVRQGKRLPRTAYAVRNKALTRPRSLPKPYLVAFFRFASRYPSRQTAVTDAPARGTSRGLSPAVMSLRYRVDPAACRSAHPADNISLSRPAKEPVHLPADALVSLPPVAYARSRELPEQSHRRTYLQ